ncbi:PqiC family protein [Methylomonas methanica]|uniref:ABC-type transport auxiliary lipoprotein component domain-containing protein n=1 Tax=Methylomonas methanica (strain DSM 25384 / MC09) TaxID=857087 RepID=G0A3P4_METMM|nr:PqiC family protein [Methylomonas methanica]AEG01516.1 protein of unknown function DUF330 [Methylomonas methanica MC09]
MRYLIRILLGLAVLAQTGCIGSSPTSRFYLLEPLAAAEAPGLSVMAGKPTLALAPVRIPHYLERAQLVSASGKNTYQLDELHRWAESLDDNMTRVILQDLSVMMPADVVSTNSQRARQAKLALAVTVLEFHIDPEGQARLTAQWQASRDDEVVLSRQSSYKVAADNDNAQLKVEALNQCLTQLNREMAAALLTINTD